MQQLFVFVYLTGWTKFMTAVAVADFKMCAPGLSFSFQHHVVDLKNLLWGIFGSVS
jgi:hypothetical protein